MLLTEDQASRISSDGLIHNAERLKELVALPLERKIGITQARIIEWYQHWGGNVYVSFSGGKDSTVLLHLVRSIFPDVPAVFSNTGLEYPEIQKFAKSFDNVSVVSPAMRFDEVIRKYGYPIISKEVAEAIYYARRITPPTKFVQLPQRNNRSFSASERIPGDRSKTPGAAGQQEQNRASNPPQRTNVRPWENWRRRCLLGDGDKDASSG